MKYERLTNRGEPFYGFEKCRTCVYGKDGCDNWCDQITGCFCRLQELEDKIESGELCEREQLVKDILIPLCKTFDSIKDYWNYYEIIYLIKEKAREYGIELFGKTEQVGNSDKLEDEE